MRISWIADGVTPTLRRFHAVHDHRSLPGTGRIEKTRERLHIVEIEYRQVAQHSLIDRDRAQVPSDVRVDARHRSENGHFLPQHFQGEPQAKPGDRPIPEPHTAVNGVESFDRYSQTIVAGRQAVEAELDGRRG
jgi:hypothetical protein